MNCLWLLILLCCSRNRSGFNIEQRCCDTDSNPYSRNNSVRCDCDNDCDCDNRRERDNDCGCERRSYIPFGNQTCSCENSQNQS